MEETLKKSLEKDYKETLQEARKARKWSQYAHWISLLAMLISSISIFIRVLQ